ATNGQWFMCTNTGTTFSYAMGTWSAGWAVQIADFDANGKADVFLYSTTGRWFECVSNGAGEFSYFTDAWSVGWQTFVTDLNGDRRSDIVLDDRTTGQWFQCLNTTLGVFSYGTGMWERDLTVVASTARVP
ncbi:MAG: FG-GAP repeat domain-containing protein, partial [Vicinamibacterales bacterium]